MTSATMLTDNELLDLIEFSIPVKWQKYMVMHGFDPQNGKIKEISEFYKRLEHAMEDNEVLPEKKKRGNLQRKRRKAGKEEASKK